MGEIDESINAYTLTSSDDVYTMSIANSTVTSGMINTVKVPPVNHFLDKYELNRVSIDHKVTESELMKLKEVAPDYVNEIKEKIARELAREVISKTTFTKKKDEDTDVNHFIGRVWVFTEAELKDMIKEITNV